MKYLNLYEKYIRKTPKKCDYVIYNTEYYDESLDIEGKITNFINNNVGKIIDIERSYSDDKPGIWFEIEYDFPTHYGITINTISVNETEIVKFSTNKEELELILDADKYNL